MWNLGLPAGRSCKLSGVRGGVDGKCDNRGTASAILVMFVKTLLSAAGEVNASYIAQL